jgi:hypothetical protein
MDFLVDGGRRRHPQKETAVYIGRTYTRPMMVLAVGLVNSF